MAAVLQSLPKSKPSAVGGKKLQERFDGRRSEELIIGFAGPIGCGIASVIANMHDRLRERGYTEVVHIKLSKFLESAIANKLVPEWEPEVGSSTRRVRYRRLQEAGKAMRTLTGNPAILAEYAAKEIALDRGQRALSAGQELHDGETIVPGRIAYLIDQVKRPEEIALLRTLYRNLFFLVGVTRIYGRRAEALEAEHVRKDEVPGLMEIDRLEGGKDGQQLDKTLHLADYFFRNDVTTTEDKKRKLNRFLDLVHGDKSVTPTDQENGMYAAYCAGLRSACLSRQVGASIATQTGEVIATGCNDVPKSGGGLYTASFEGADMRCVHREGQICSNDQHKSHLKDEIGTIIDAALKQAAESAGQPIKLDRTTLLDSIYTNTRLKDLIEFSRSVHAEMDAIVSLARIGGTGIQGSVLYTTTFPCHSCARHIVAAGISRVFYMEPYEKSLAKDLHSDAIAFEIEATADKSPKKVEFLHFEGAAPRQFHNMFRANGRKDSSGKFVPIRLHQANKGVPEYLDNYQDFEAKAVQHLAMQLESLGALNSIDNGDSVGEDQLHNIEKGA